LITISQCEIHRKRKASPTFNLEHKTFNLQPLSLTVSLVFK
jgi:hypothetical protein